MIPQGVFLPRTLLPFTWYSLSLPTTAKGMLSCWMAETQANTHAQSSSSPHRTSQGRTAFHSFLCCSFTDAPGGKVKTLPLEKAELGLPDYTVVWLVSLRKLAFLQPESTLYGSLCLSTVSLDLEPLCELARTDSHKQHPHPPAPGASQTPRCVMYVAPMEPTGRCPGTKLSGLQAALFYQDKHPDVSAWCVLLSSDKRVMYCLRTRKSCEKS